MLEFAKTYFPILVLVLLSAIVLLQILMIAFWPSRIDLIDMSKQIFSIEQKLFAAINLLDSIQQTIDRVSNENSDLHALAAHFVPYRRTKQDVSNLHYYHEERGYGVGVENEFYDELEKQSPQSKSTNPTG